jgi:hypothetical protein
MGCTEEEDNGIHETKNNLVLLKIVIFPVSLPWKRAM